MFDYRALPLQTAATLALGLPESSRIKRKKSGLNIQLSTFLLSVIADRLGLLVYANTKGAKHGTNAPKSITAMLLGKADNDKPAVFSSPEEFWAARNAILGKS